jgi:hypothetical protein
MEHIGTNKVKSIATVKLIVSSYVATNTEERWCSLNVPSAQGKIVVFFEYLRAHFRLTLALRALWDL